MVIDPAAIVSVRGTAGGTLPAKSVAGLRMAGVSSRLALLLPLLLTVVLAGSGRLLGARGEHGEHAGDAVEKKAKKLEELTPDERRLKRLELFIKTAETAMASYSEKGLRVKAAVVPDALAYRLTRRYLEERRAGKDDVDAISALASGARTWRHLAGRPLVHVVLANDEFELGKSSRRIFTVAETLPGRALVLLSRKRVVPLVLAEKPANLRTTKVRVRKFWKVKKGRGRRGRRGRRVPGDTSGYEPILSRPIGVHILEKKPAEIDLLPRRKLKGSLAGLTLRIDRFKRYEGPFKSDEIDLNEGRRWDALPAITLRLAPPPEGGSLPPEVRRLVDKATGGVPR